jgi:hypothetical protein
MNAFAFMIKDYRVGFWCRLAAWLSLAIAILHFLVSILITFINLHGLFDAYVVGVSTASALLSYAGPALFNFFILYAAGVAVDHLTGTPPLQAEEEGEEGEVALEETEEA